MAETVVNKTSDEHSTVSLDASAHTVNPDYKGDLLSKVRANRFNQSPGRWTKIQNIVIPTAVKKRKEEIENESLEQDIRLKRHTLYALFTFLLVETIVVFLFSYLQATGKCGFYLEDWSFRLLVAATISQITYMLQVAVRHLFPNNHSAK